MGQYYFESQYINSKIQLILILYGFKGLKALNEMASMAFYYEEGARIKKMSYCNSIIWQVIFFWRLSNKGLIANLKIVFKVTLATYT